MEGKVSTSTPSCFWPHVVAVPAPSPPLPTDSSLPLPVSPAAPYSTQWLRLPWVFDRFGLVCLGSDVFFQRWIASFHFLCFSTSPRPTFREGWTSGVTRRQGAGLGYKKVLNKQTSQNMNWIIVRHTAKQRETEGRKTKIQTQTDLHLWGRKRRSFSQVFILNLFQRIVCLLSGIISPPPSGCSSSTSVTSKPRPLPLDTSSRLMRDD